MREEVVAKVVLHSARRADDDAPHLIPEVARKPGQQQQDAAIRPELGSRHAGVEIVDRVLQDPGRHREQRRAQDERNEAQGVLAAVSSDIRKEDANRCH